MEFLRGRDHQFGVETADDVQKYGFDGAEFFGSLGGKLARAGSAAEDDLSGAIEIDRDKDRLGMVVFGDGFSEDGLTEFFDVGLIEAEDGDHGAFLQFGGLLHALPADLDQSESVSERQGAGGV